MYCKKNRYLWTYDLYGPVRNCFDAGRYIIRASAGRGRALEIETLWALRNGIEPLGECYLGPKKVEISMAKPSLKLNQKLIKNQHETVTCIKERSGT
jgi:hypothetical protein